MTSRPIKQEHKDFHGHNKEIKRVSSVGMSKHTAHKVAKATQMKEDGKMMHKRSRNGCYTCRLRRKKCDENKPCCGGCASLRIECEYSKPKWWTYPELRSEHKEKVKNQIKNTQMTQKRTTVGPRHEAHGHYVEPVQTEFDSVPSLVHSSAPTTSDTYSEHMTRTRRGSTDSHPSPQFFDYDRSKDFFSSTPAMPAPHWTPLHANFAQYPPYEIDVKTDRQTFINDLPMGKDTTISTFSSYPYSTPQSSTGPFPNGWVHQEIFESTEEHFIEEPADFHYFNYPHSPLTPNHEAVIHVDEGHQYLLNHFLDNVAKMLFPILEVNQPGSARQDVILPAMESNRTYLSCCLSVAGLHLKATESPSDPRLDTDIMANRYNAILELSQAMGRLDADYHQLLEATLGMIFFQSLVEPLQQSETDLQDVPWHSHFDAASKIINTLDLHQAQPTPQPSPDPNNAVQAPKPPPFNLALASWIDIIGATILGRTPSFAEKYGEKLTSGVSSGLSELMGCDDKVMYLISETASLEHMWSQNAIDDLTLCHHIGDLGVRLGPLDHLKDVDYIYTAATGALKPRQLCKNITAAFCFALRLYLCGLIPTWDRTHSDSTAITDLFTRAMDFIPSGSTGYDRAVVWPLLIVGATSLPTSSFRSMFAKRCADLGAAAEFGTFGRVKEILTDLWAINDENLPVGGEKACIHWRDVMKQKGWDVLLI